MAGAFDNFDDTPKPKKGAFDDFDSGMQPPAPAAYAGDEAFWNKPADVSWSQYIAAHAAHALPPLHSSLQQNVNEAALLGQGVTGGLSGFIPGVRGINERAAQETPLAEQMALQQAGYALGPAKVMGAVRALPAVARFGGKVASTVGQKLATILGSAGEGALVSGTGEAGAGGSASDVARAMTTGGVLSGITGALPAARSKVNTPSAADLKSKSDIAWRGPPNEAVAPSDVSKALVDAHFSLTPGERAIYEASPIKEAVKSAMRNARVNSVSADDVYKWRELIMDSAKKGPQKRLAGKFGDALDSTYSPTAAQSVADASHATNVAKTGREIEQWMADPASAPKEIRGALAKNPDFYKTQPELPVILSRISQIDQPSVARQMIDKTMSHLGNTAAGSVLGAVFGHPIAGALAGAVKGPATTAGVSALEAAKIRKALQQARHLNATGQSLPQGAFTPSRPWMTGPSDFLRQMGYAAGASGRY